MPSKKKKYNARFPPARIKKIMQKDEDVGKVAAPVPVVISKALEIFLESLIRKASQETLSKNAKTLTSSHIKHCIEQESKFDFLKDLVENVPTLNCEDEETNHSEKQITSRRKQKIHRDSSAQSSVQSVDEPSSDDDSFDSDDSSSSYEFPKFKGPRSRKASSSKPLLSKSSSTSSSTSKSSLSRNSSTSSSSAAPSSSRVPQHMSSSNTTMPSNAIPQVTQLVPQMPSGLPSNIHPGSHSNMMPGLVPNVASGIPTMMVPGAPYSMVPGVPSCVPGAPANVLPGAPVNIGQVTPANMPHIVHSNNPSGIAPNMPPGGPQTVSGVPQNVPHMLLPHGALGGNSPAMGSYMGMVTQSATNNNNQEDNSDDDYDA